MVRRTITALLLLAVILPAIYFGGILYFILAAAFIVLAAWEYVQMFQIMKFEPSWLATVGGALAILTARAFWPEHAAAVFAGMVLLVMTVHLIAYERGRMEAALDLVIALTGVVYLGWVGAYMIDLRSLPDGGWWVMLVFPVVWLADTAAYFVGRQYGRHKMLPRLSPHKSWEGYWAGVVAGTLSAGLLAYLYARFGFMKLGIVPSLLLGLILSTLTTLGDVGESLFKRFANAKDSGSLLPGHGGAFDRIDSLIWAGVLGYFWIRYFMI